MNLQINVSSTASERTSDFSRSAPFPRSGQTFVAEVARSSFPLSPFVYFSVILLTLSARPSVRPFEDETRKRRVGSRASKREGEHGRRFASLFFCLLLFSSSPADSRAREKRRRGKTTQQTRQAGQRGSLKRARLNLVMWSPKETWKNRYERLTFHSPFLRRANPPRDPRKNKVSRKWGSCRIAASRVELAKFHLRGYDSPRGPGRAGIRTRCIFPLFAFLPVFFFFFFFLLPFLAYTRILINSGCYVEICTARDNDPSWLRLRRALITFSLSDKRPCERSVV